MIAIATCSMFFHCITGGRSQLFYLLFFPREGNAKCRRSAKQASSLRQSGSSCLSSSREQHSIWCLSNPDYRQQLNDMSQQMYGETFDDMFKRREGAGCSMSMTIGASQSYGGYYGIQTQTGCVKNPGESEVTAPGRGTPSQQSCETLQGAQISGWIRRDGILQIRLTYFAFRFRIGCPCT